MILPLPSPQYDAQNEAQTRRAIAQEDSRNLKKGQNVDVRGGKLILTAPNGTRFAVTVSNAGVLGTVAL